MNTEEERELFDKWYGKKPMGWFEAVRYNTAWRAWQASANREGYKLVPVCKHEWSIQLSGRFICDLCGEFMDEKP